MMIRDTTPKDVPELQRVLAETGLFPSEMLPDLLSGYLSDDAGKDVWLTCDSAGVAVGFCYAAPDWKSLR